MIITSCSCLLFKKREISEGFSSFDFAFQVNKALKNMSTNRDLSMYDFKKDQLSTDQMNRLVFEEFLWRLNQFIPYNFTLINIEDSEVETYENMKKFNLQAFIYDPGNNFGSTLYVTLLKDNEKPSELIRGKLIVEEIKTSTNLEKPPTYYPYTSVVDTSALRSELPEEYAKMSKVPGIFSQVPSFFSKEEKNIMTKEQLNEILDIKNKNAQMEDQESQNVYQCFGGQNVGAKTEESCVNSGGFWDTPVKDSSDCPFYKSNENYPNARGGMRESGYCEMPIGVQTLGFRGVRSGTKPLCYNCLTVNEQGETIKALGDCCEDQKNNPEMYPKLVTPDYAFPGDLIERRANKDHLLFKGINPERNQAMKSV